jgi:hypothetical protein
VKRLIWLLCLTFAAPSWGEEPAADLAYDHQAGDSLRQLHQLSAELPTELSNEVDPRSLRGAWTEKSQKVLEEVFIIHERLITHWERARAAFAGSDEAFAEEMIKRGKVSVKVEGLGVGELNMIDDAPFVRVVHQGSEIAFMLYEEGSIHPDSDHLQTYLARQHIDAGAARADGQTGRDVVMIAKGKGAPLQRAQLDDPSRFLRSDRLKAWRSAAWWRDYWKATYRKSTKSTWGFGTVCGLSQGGLALCVAGLKTAVNPEAVMDLSPAFLSGGWGTGIGAYVSTYKNWTNRGSTFMRTLKSSFNGALFGYALIMMNDDDGMDSLSIMDPAGLLVHATVIGNVVANNFAKTHWNDFALVREQVGISRRSFEMKLPWGKSWKTKVSQSAVESQGIYLAPFSIRLLDLVQFTVGAFPLGKFVLWTSIPFVEFAVMRYTEKLAERTQHPKAFELAKEQRRVWELKKRMMWDFELMQGQAQRVWAKVRGDVREQDALNRLLSQKYPDLIKREVLSSRANTNPLEAFEIPEAGRSRVQCSQSLGGLLR